MRVRVGEPRATTPPDHELETARGRGDREVSIIEESFDFRGLRRGGDLSRDPVGDEGKRRTLRKSSAFENESNQRRRREGRGNPSEIPLIRELELELLMRDAFFYAVQGFPLESSHSKTRGKTREGVGPLFGDSLPATDEIIT